MSEIKTPIRSLNGHALVDEQARADIEALKAGGGSAAVTQKQEKPLVYIDGTIPTTKDNVLATMTVKSSWLNLFAYIKIKCQGTSSMNYPKKNFTVTLYQDEERTIPLEITIPGWKNASNKFVLKANYIDHLHARNIISARLWSEIVASRSDYDTLPQEFKNSPNNGAVDGFPVIVSLNGAYTGIYTWNIGKDDWLWNMDEDNPNHVLLCAETNASGGYAETPCNFRALWGGVDETDWSVEVGTNSDAVKNSLNALISCVKDTDDATFKETIGNYLDLQSAIDYWIFQYAACGIDGLAKNMLLGTYDLQKWIMGAYDLDSTWGLHWDGTLWRPANERCPETYQEPYSLLFERISKIFAAEVNARYLELRGNVLGYSNILSKFERFTAEIGADSYADDLIAFPGIPQGESNNIWQIRNFVKERLEYTDSMFGVFEDNMFTLGENGSYYATNIGDVLSADWLTITEDGGIVGKDDGWSSALAYRIVDFPNENVEYTLSADFERVDGEGEAEKRMVVQARDKDGMLMTTGVSGGEYVGGYSGFLKVGNSWSFTLSDDVATFRVGFIFNAAPSTSGVEIKVSNIVLKKAVN